MMVLVKVRIQSRGRDRVKLRVTIRLSVVRVSFMIVLSHDQCNK